MSGDPTVSEDSQTAAGDPAGGSPARRTAGTVLRVGLAAAVFVALALALTPGKPVPTSATVVEPPDVGAHPATAPGATTAPEWPGVTRDADGRLRWPHPRTPDRQHERDSMVETQIARGGPYSPAVRNEDVLAALRAVPRHEFVPAERSKYAYHDSPLPIGHGQTISQPYIVGLMTELLALRPGDRVLEIGTGSGYQAAVLAELTPYVCTIEVIEPLYRQGTRRLERLGYVTVRTRLGDGYDGWPEYGPFDAIIVTCAAGHVPPPLWEQLRPGGRMVIPIGGAYETQRLVLLTKQPDGSRRSRDVLPVAFVPMTGKIRSP